LGEGKAVKRARWQSVFWRFGKKYWDRITFLHSGEWANLDGRR